MKIIKCDYSHGFDAHCEEAVAAAAEDLAAGRLIVYPTETVYGIGADIYNESAVKNLYVAKNRPFDMPLSVAVSDKAMLESIAVLNENADKLVKAFPVKLPVLYQNVIADVILDDFLVYLKRALRRFRSFPFRRLCRFVPVIRQGI